MTTISEVYEKCQAIVGQEFDLPITKNKGRPGLFLEELLGIPHSSRPLDCDDGEVKCVPVKKLGRGTIVAKETIAVTMLSCESITQDDFAHSKCLAKMSRMLVVPYDRTGDTIVYMTPTIIDIANPEYAKLYKILEEDYETIRQKYINNETPTGSDGVLLQNRTKGAGHGSTSRAFYLRPQFVNQYVLMNIQCITNNSAQSPPLPLHQES